MRRIRLDRLWLRRIGTATTLWAIICVGAALLGSRPRPVVLAGIVLGVAAVAWLAADLIAETEMISWHAGYEPYHRVRGDDVRVRRLLHLLQDTDHPQTFARELHPLLVELVDDRLDTRYGVDRHDHPRAAAQLLGEDLMRFLHSPPPPGSADPRHLSMILTRIEAL